jgi:predicted DNA-binding transcriptional regulator YafY
MPQFEVTGDLLTDVQNAIDYKTVLELSYVDSKGAYSTRHIAPLEIRGDRFYAWDLGKNGLRLFLMMRVQDFSVTDDAFNPEYFG